MLAEVVKRLWNAGGRWRLLAVLVAVIAFAAELAGAESWLEKAKLEPSGLAVVFGNVVGFAEQHVFSIAALVLLGVVYWPMIRPRREQLEKVEILEIPAAVTAVEIALSDPPDDTVESWLEWPHLTVKNVSGRRLLFVRAKGSDLFALRQRRDRREAALGPGAR